MPASQPVEFYRGLEGTIEPVGKESEVHFTDESPSFQLTLLNPTDFEFVEDSAIIWVIAIGEGEPEPIYSDKLEFELGPNESKTFEIGGQLLAYEGHGVVGLNCGGARTDEKERVLRPGSINMGSEPVRSSSRTADKVAKGDYWTYSSGCLLRTGAGHNSRDVTSTAPPSAPRSSPAPRPPGGSPRCRWC